MHILTPEILPKHGPYIYLAALPSPLELDEGDWPERSTYEDHIFFRLADDLVGTVCDVSRSYLFFDSYDFIQLRKPEMAYEFVAGILRMATRVATCPIHYFKRELSIYEGSLIPEECRSEHHLKNDIAQTLIHIADLSTSAIRDGKYLAIIGI